MHFYIENKMYYYIIYLIYLYKETKLECLFVILKKITFISIKYEKKNTLGKN